MLNAIDFSENCTSHFGRNPFPKPQIIPVLKPPPKSIFDRYFIVKVWMWNSVDSILK